MESPHLQLTIDACLVTYHSCRVLETAEVPQIVDWKLVQELYAQGLTAEEIASRSGATVNAIRTRASREKWRDLVIASKAVAVQDISLRWQFDMITWHAARANALRAMTVTNLIDAQRLESTVAMHVDTGRKLLGLDAEKQNGGEKGFQRGPVVDVTVHAPKQLTD